MAEVTEFKTIPRIKGKLSLQEDVIYSTPNSSCDKDNNKICIPMSDYDELCKRVGGYSNKIRDMAVLNAPGVYRQIITNDKNSARIGKPYLTSSGDCRIKVNIRSTYEGANYDRDFIVLVYEFKYFDNTVYASNLGPLVGWGNINLQSNQYKWDDGRPR